MRTAYFCEEVDCYCSAFFIKLIKCAILIYSGIFIFLRYDGETFVRSVDANFIVWENFNRKDYYFNATMHQVICVRCVCVRQYVFVETLKLSLAL